MLSINNNNIIGSSDGSGNNHSKCNNPNGDIVDINTADSNLINANVNNNIKDSRDNPNSAIIRTNTTVSNLTTANTTKNIITNNIKDPPSTFDNPNSAIIGTNTAVSNSATANTTKTPPHSDIESIFIQNIGKLFGKAMITYIMTKMETTYSEEEEDDDDGEDDIDDQFRSRYKLINRAIKALATFIINTSPESERSLLDLYRAEKAKLTRMVTDLAVKKYMDNPFQRAIIRHASAGDSNTISFLEQEIKNRNPKMTTHEAMKIVANFKNDLINIFCLPIIEIIAKLSNDANVRLDMYMVIVAFVEREYSTCYTNHKDFSEINFANLVYDLNLYYLQQRNRDEKITISEKDLEFIKSKHLPIPDGTSLQLASNIYFKNDPLLGRLPVNIDSIYRIATFLASVKSIEDKSIICQGTFEYIIFLLRQCLTNEALTSCNNNYSQNLQDLGDYHSSFIDSFVEFERRFKKRINKRKWRSNNNNNNNNRKDDSNDEDDDGYDDNMDTYNPVMVNSDNNSFNNRYYLATGIFGDGSIIGQRLISLVENGDIAGLQKLTDSVLAYNNNNNVSPFINLYVQNLIDIISVQGERLKNIKLFQCESSVDVLPGSISSSSSSSCHDMLKNESNFLNDSSLAARETDDRCSIIINYESALLTNMSNEKIITNSSSTDNKMMLITDMFATQLPAHNLFIEIFTTLLQKAFPNETITTTKRSILSTQAKTMSPFGPDSVIASVYAIEFFSLKKNVRTIHLLKKKNHHNDDSELLLKFNTAIESSLQDIKVAEAKKKVVEEAKTYLERNGATIINIIEHITTTEKNKDTVTLPYSLNSLIEGIMTVLVKTIYLTRLKILNTNTVEHHTATAASTSSHASALGGDIQVLMLIPEIVEWLVEHLASQVETAMSSILETKLPSRFEDQIYESNKSKLASTAVTESEIGKLFIQSMANDYLTNIDNVLNVPHSNQHHRLREQLVRLVVDKSTSVLKKQCWTLIIMVVMILIDHNRDTTLNIQNINLTEDNEASNLVAYLNILNIDKNRKKQLKQVISAVCLSVAKKAAFSFARLSNSHFAYLLQRFNIVPRNSGNYQYNNSNNKRMVSNININNNNDKSSPSIPASTTKRYKRGEYFKLRQSPSSIKHSNITILDGIINKYQNVSN